MKVIEIQPTDDLSKIERAIGGICRSPQGEEFTIRLARNLNAHFFKQSWIAALFATAAQRGFVHFRDWHDTWSSEDVDGVLRSSVGHFAAAVYATRLSNERGTEVGLKVNDLTAAVAANGGILEPHTTTKRELIGTALTFCSIDPTYSEPLMLAGLIYHKMRFVDEFTTIKRRDLDRDHSYANLELFGDESPDRQLAAYVFELYQNGYEHGNRRKEDKKALIPGLRFISVRKHIAANFNQIRGYADGFPELAQFLHRNFDDHSILKYYEVAVSDQGLGMLDRFLADRGEFFSEATGRAARLHLLRRLLTETLTSKKLAPGAGGGLIRALRAAKELRGFISVRTAEFWLICSFAGESSNPFELIEVKNSGDSTIAGTHFNALFPLRR